MICSVGSTSFHQASTTAPGDLHDLIYRVAFSIQPNGLVARACGGIFAVAVGLEQLLPFCFAQFEFSLCHAYIVRPLTILSMRIIEEKPQSSAAHLGKVEIYTRIHDIYRVRQIIVVLGPLKTSIIRNEDIFPISAE